MAESHIVIPAFDNKMIYGTYRFLENRPVVVICHGMTCDMDSRLEVNFSRTLESRGYSSIRYNAYDWHDDGRNLNEMSLTEYINDVGSVIKWATRQNSHVYVVGHSFGALCALLRGSKSLSGAVLWDPGSQEVWAGNVRSTAEFDESRREYIINEGLPVIYSERMLDEMDNANAEMAAREFKAPLLIVSATEFAHFTDAGRRYYENAPDATRIVFDGAGHDFIDDEMESRLFDATIAWLDDHSNLY